MFLHFISLSPFGYITTENNAKQSFSEALQQKLLQHSVTQSGAAISETQRSVLYMIMLIVARQYSLTNVDFPDCVGQRPVIVN